MRKFWVVVSVLISMLMVILLSVSYSVKSIVVDTVGVTVVKDEGAKVIADLIYDNLDPSITTSKKLLEETVKNSDYLDDITNKYFDAVVKDIDKNPDMITSPNIKAESSKIIKECLEAIEKQQNIKLTDQQKQDIINEFVTDENLNLVYKQVVSTIQHSNNSKLSELVNTYNFFTSNTVRLVFWGFLATCVLIIVVASKPKVSAILALGLTLLLSGLLIAFIIMPIVNFIGPDLTKQLSENSNTIKASFLSGCGWVLIGSGVITLFIFYILNKFSNKEKELV